MGPGLASKKADDRGGRATHGVVPSPWRFGSASSPVGWASLGRSNKLPALRFAAAGRLIARRHGRPFFLGTDRFRACSIPRSFRDCRIRRYGWRTLLAQGWIFHDDRAHDAAPQVRESSGAFLATPAGEWMAHCAHPRKPVVSSVIHANRAGCIFPDWFGGPKPYGSRLLPRISASFLRRRKGGRCNGRAFVVDCAFWRFFGHVRVNSAQVPSAD